MDLDLSLKEETVSERFEKSLSEGQRSYRNCAVFVKYLIGIDEEKKLLQDLNSKKEDGLLYHLNVVDVLHFNQEDEEPSEDKYFEKANKSEVVGLLINNTIGEKKNDFEGLINKKREGWAYVHFATIDLNDKAKVFQRPDIEREPEHTSWKNFAKYYKEFPNCDWKIVFFNKK